MLQHLQSSIFAGRFAHVTLDEAHNVKSNRTHAWASFSTKLQDDLFDGYSNSEQDYGPRGSTAAYGA